MKKIGNTTFSEQTIKRIKNNRTKEEKLFGRLENIAILEQKCADIKRGKSHLAIAN